jgi:hypothetical protein
MNRLSVETCGISNWRERLARPDSQWKRRYSAFETAVSWENAGRQPAGLPKPIGDLFRGSIFGEATLLLAIAEHKVPLVGGTADSQCDVWALLNTAAGGLSLSVEAKANEAFGQGNESLQDWLIAGGSERSRQNRENRWEHISAHLPRMAQDPYSLVPYQLLHRCAAAVIEAKRFRLSAAAFVVQAFGAPDESLEAFGRLCQVLNVNVKRGQMQQTTVEAISLGVGWADCPFATDAEVAGVA